MPKSRVRSAEPELACEVAAHRALRARLSAHYAILEESVPKRLAAPLRRRGTVVELPMQRKARAIPQFGIPPWGWIAGPALAASLVLALLIPRGSALEGYAGKQIATALDDQLVATQPANAHVRVLLSFRDGSGAYCRAFAAAEQSGTACKDMQGWRVVERLDGGDVESGEYRQAGSISAELMAKAQELANGSALDAKEEAEAKGRLWAPA